ncbi:MAG: hypothetical protein M1422_02910, partial [Candidatus Thermoplasmatota archaeon]|nr:hypothetical protein [Candidatus Thermoplasmatota archaeon]MCL5253821.1 hypothetical protein [Candidatus Thermoplasmatota archaeon]
CYDTFILLAELIEIFPQKLNEIHVFVALMTTIHLNLFSEISGLDRKAERRRTVVPSTALSVGINC